MKASIVGDDIIYLRIERAVDQVRAQCGGVISGDYGQKMKLALAAAHAAQSEDMKAAAYLDAAEHLSVCSFCWCQKNDLPDEQQIRVLDRPMQDELLRRRASWLGGICPDATDSGDSGSYKLRDIYECGNAAYQLHVWFAQAVHLGMVRADDNMPEWAHDDWHFLKDAERIGGLITARKISLADAVMSPSANDFFEPGASHHALLRERIREINQLEKDFDGLPVWARFFGGFPDK